MVNALLASTAQLRLEFWELYVSLSVLIRSPKRKTQKYLQFHSVTILLFNYCYVARFCCTVYCELSWKVMNTNKLQLLLLLLLVVVLLLFIPVYSGNKRHVIYFCTASTIIIKKHETVKDIRTNINSYAMLLTRCTSTREWSASVDRNNKLVACRRRQILNVKFVNWFADISPDVAVSYHVRRSSRKNSGPT